MVKRKKSLFDRCFRAADIWITKRGLAPGAVATAEQELAHVGYRCGWYAGYTRAVMDMRAAEGKSDV